MDSEPEKLPEVPQRVRVNTWVPLSTYQFLEAASARENRSQSDLVREALRDYQLKYLERRKLLQEGE